MPPAAASDGRVLGTPVVGWFDTEGENYASSIAAMETNSATLNMIMFRPE